MSSFSMKLKNELLSLSSSDESLKAMLEGLLQVNGTINLSSTGLFLEFKSKNEQISQTVAGLIKHFYNLDSIMLKTKEIRLNKDDVYVTELHQNANIVLSDLKVLQAKEDSSYNLKKELSSDEAKIGYLRGAFLAAGSINDPKTHTYHLEIQTFSTLIAYNLRDLMNTFNLGSKISKNRRGYIVYCKSADKIADFIRILGASDQLFYFEDLRIERDLSNSINRVMNCEIANQKKATVAALRQLDEIAVVEKFYGERLKNTLKEICVLRKKYPEDSLLELSTRSVEEFNKSISKSAINHRLREIHELYLSIKSNQEKNNS